MRRLKRIAALLLVIILVGLVFLTLYWCCDREPVLYGFL